MHSRMKYVPLVLLTISVVGCARSEAPAPAAKASPYVLTDEPAGAIDVRAAVKSVKDKDSIVVVGRIGGEVNPFVEGVAAFTIVDRSLTPCNERPGDSCPTPWDYCCDIPDLPTSSAAVKVVDRDSHVVAEGAKGLLGVKELDTVVVRGRASRDSGGNLVLLADAIYIRK